MLKAPRAIGINREGEDVVQIRHPKMLPQDIDYNLHARGAILEVGRHATTSENLLRRRGHVLGVDPMTDQDDTEEGDGVGGGPGFHRHYTSAFAPVLSAKDSVSTPRRCSMVT